MTTTTMKEHRFRGHLGFLARIALAVLAAPARGQTIAPIPVQTMLQAKKFLTWDARPSSLPMGRCSLM